MSDHSPEQESVAPVAQAYAFPGKALFSPIAFSKLRLQRAAFVAALAARLSLLLRSDGSAKPSRLQPPPCQNWSQNRNEPACPTIFKLDPLRGVSVLQIPPPLAASV